MYAISLSPCPFVQESIHMDVIASAIETDLYTQPIYHIKHIKEP